MLLEEHEAHCLLVAEPRCNTSYRRWYETKHIPCVLTSGPVYPSIYDEDVMGEDILSVPTVTSNTESIGLQLRKLLSDVVITKVFKM